MHTREFLVLSTTLARSRVLKPYWFFATIAEHLPPELIGKTELRGAELSDGDVVVIYDEEEHRIGVIHYLGPYTDDQSFCRFSVVDMTQESVLIATTRHAINVDAPIQEMRFAGIETTRQKVSA